MLVRSAGVLLHPTSLPGPYGIGDLGPMACRWIDTLAAMKQSWWQVLPLGPTGFGDSPYQSYSAFASNTLLLSPERLIEDGLLPKDFAPPKLPESAVDFPAVTAFKTAMLRLAWEHFRSGDGRALKPEFDTYCEREAGWLHDYALFMAIRDALGGRSLSEWPKELRLREPTALAAMERDAGGAINRLKFGQFLFDRQWSALRAYAMEKGVRILGDVPIFVAGDSADVWAFPDQFLLDAEGKPKVVAGVPPDYFSEDGQHWGNPIYDWPAMAADGYRWWIARLRRGLTQCDLLRLDHFRGFAQAWHIPAGETTARNGAWVDGGGSPFFSALKTAFGRLPLVAEDLGVITPDVDALRAALKLPGMRVLQFMLGDPTNPYQPHNFDRNSLCYTGTHDNDTSRGWYESLGNSDRDSLMAYLGHPVADAARDLVRLAWASVSRLAIAPLQDVLSLGAAARMNVPGRPDGNWRWRVRLDEFTPDRIDWLARLTERFNRAPARVGRAESAKPDAAPL